ncbi:histidine kinase [Enterococcus mundtii]|uniref:sensor histidine kinase n=1 Tax=Enterococcus mundtii TaxID=53346 RepID=UPI00129CC867|nr:sensor histidine kinase [Enterococcus mundtii]MRI73670.1 histidine kinase [Enterococcus mundtii]
MERINTLCQRYTNLTQSDIQELCRTSAYLAESKHYEMADVFIDVFNEMTKEALVVYHKKPKYIPSLYKHEVVGKEALLKNEPGVLRTMETSLNSIGLLAVTQENRLIKQNIFPIRNEQRTIGVIIVEEGVEQPIGAVERQELQSNEQGTIAIESTVDPLIMDQLAEAVLIFDTTTGNLVLANHRAKELYRKLGYREMINDLHYDNLSLDYTTFEYVLYQMNDQTKNRLIELETAYLNYYFNIRKVWIDAGSRVAMIIQDNTEVKKKEDEIVSKSVAIREIHHRVKNNLQSVVSLLRIQARRTTSKEASKVLKESVNRIMAIAMTHELLSKQVEDNVSLRQMLEAVMYNFRHIFNPEKVRLNLTVDPTITVSSDQMVSISLVVNELLQNIFDHAFEADQNGVVEVSGEIENRVITITVTDNGNGYDINRNKETSLGLMIVNSYIKDKLKGKVKIESSNKGTKTCFYFEQNTKDVVR